MGSGVSISPPSQPSEQAKGIKDYQLRQLPDAIEESIFIHEKFPLILDPTEQAARFVKNEIHTPLIN